MILQVKVDPADQQSLQFLRWAEDDITNALADSALFWLDKLTFSRWICSSLYRRSESLSFLG